MSMVKNTVKNKASKAEQPVTEAEEQISLEGLAAEFDKLEKLLKELYDFRFNLITKSPELKKEGIWAPLTDFELNTIVRKVRKKGNKFATPSRVDEVLHGDFLETVNPIQEYFSTLGSFDGDPIGELAATLHPIKEGDEELIEKYLRKWLVAVVANVFIEGRCANQTCFIIAGGQGLGKSTWIRRLIPKELEPYYYEGGIDPDNKDAIIATTCNFIINLDDYFAGITAKKINEFKGFITKNTVQVRRAYGRFAEHLDKISSFIASSNEESFLHDQTGNRRFLPFAVRSIDLEAAKAVDMNQVWCQAYQLFQRGFEYWVGGKDQKELEEHNKQFEVQPIEYEAIARYYRHPAPGEQPKHLTNGDILTELKNKGYMVTTKKLGEALRKAGFEKKSVRKKDEKDNRVVVQAYPVIRIVDPEDFIPVEDSEDQEAAGDQDARVDDLPF